MSVEVLDFEEFRVEQRVLDFWVLEFRHLGFGALCAEGVALWVLGRRQWPSQTLQPDWQYYE